MIDLQKRKLEPSLVQFIYESMTVEFNNPKYTGIGRKKPQTASHHLRLLPIDCLLVVVVFNAKPARAVALLLGDHDSSHASTDPPGDSIVLPDLIDPSLSWSAQTMFPLVVGWSTKGQVDMAVEGLVRRDILM